MYTREGPFLSDTSPIILVMTLRMTAVLVHEEYIYFANVLNDDDLMSTIAHLV